MDLWLMHMDGLKEPKEDIYIYLCIWIYMYMIGADNVMAHPCIYTSAVKRFRMGRLKKYIFLRILFRYNIQQNQ